MEIISIYKIDLNTSDEKDKEFYSQINNIFEIFLGDFKRAPMFDEIMCNPDFDMDKLECLFGIENKFQFLPITHYNDNKIFEANVDYKTCLKRIKSKIPYAFELIRIICELKKE